MKKIFKCVVKYGAVAFSAFVGTLAGIHVAKSFEKKREQLGNELASGLADLIKGFEGSQSAGGCCDDEEAECCCGEGCCDGKEAECCCGEGCCDGKEAECCCGEECCDGKDAEGCCWENEKECECCTCSDCPKMAETEVEK